MSHQTNPGVLVPVLVPGTMDHRRNFRTVRSKGRRKQGKCDPNILYSGQRLGLGDHSQSLTKKKDFPK